jgi:hypothetical protein
MYLLLERYMQVWTKTRPFPGMSDIAIAMKVLRGDRPHRPTPDACDGAIFPDHLWQLVQKCWAHDPTIRPTIDEILLDSTTLGWPDGTPRQVSDSLLH